MESLVECQLVKDAFTEILSNHCKPLKRYVRMVWASMLLLSLVMVFLVLTWTVQTRHEQKHHIFGSSVKPNSATANEESAAAADDQVSQNGSKHDQTWKRETERKMGRLRDCIEELTKFTLESHVNGTLEIDLPLSKDFCSSLLAPDPNDAVLSLLPDATDCSRGVPEYPLYRRLSSALYHSVTTTTSGEFRASHGGMTSVNADVKLDEEEDCSKLVGDEGSKLSSVSGYG
ncbi:hypothetical protein Tsubulata_051356 [Turnera subulata]|uniref:Uncharacterized protein n=1 Tax=Turnera subulata TaxID=218843 RepID=A0A9Q0FZI3_9ROSI|nr:hypothetical protein Tsubulata_051356 [Turnera subulata]